MATERQWFVEDAQVDEQTDATEFFVEGLQLNETVVADAPSGDVLPVGLSQIETGQVVSRGMHEIESGFVA